MAGERRHSGAADPSHPAHSLKREIGPAHETRGHTKRIRRAVQIDDSHELPSSFEHAGSNGKKKRAGTGDDRTAARQHLLALQEECRGAKTDHAG